MKPLVLAIAIIIFWGACNDDNNTTPNPAATTSSVSISNLPADPPTGYDPTNGKPIGEKNQFTYFRFADSTILTQADSASSKWDIAFKGATIILNSGSSGPGTASGFVMNGVFSDLAEVPADSTFRKDQAPTYAISNWTSYEPVSKVLSPTPGKIFVIKTNDNKYVKMEVLCYYKDCPAQVNAFVHAARYYTFRYTLQKDGSKKFK